jgi:hypothetical protein
VKIVSMTMRADGLAEARKELQRLSRPPMKTIAELETVAAQGFAATQAATHIITGSLKISGKLATDFDGRMWDMQVTYGGSATGAVFDPVRYAIYERARGGDHDFMAPLLPYEDKIGDILNKHFDGKTGVVR